MGGLMSDAAIVSIVTGVVTIATLWFRVKYGSDKVENKIDNNTALTVAGTAAAAANAKAAKEAVANTKDAVLEKLNGGMTHAVEHIIGPIKESLENLAQRVTKLEEYNHGTAHRILDAINTLHLKVAELVVENNQPPKTES